MSKTPPPTPTELLQAELAALHQADEERAARVRRIEALQLPIADEVAGIILTKTVAEAANLLPALAAGLTDNMQTVVNNLISQIGYAAQVLDAERSRIQGQIDADAKAQAEPEAKAPA